MEELIIKEREFKENLVKIINESGLPAFIIKPTLKEMLEQIVAIEKEQYEEAKNNKNKEVKEKNKKSK